MGGVGKLSGAALTALSIPAPARIDTPVRELNSRLWALLTKPGPLSAEEWAYIEECERNG